MFVGWCSVVVWLNIEPSRPIRSWDVLFDTVERPQGQYKVRYGCPWTYAERSSGDPILFPRLYPDVINYITLALNTAIGILAALVLTWTSTYVLRRILSWIASPGRKSRPPDS